MSGTGSPDPQDAMLKAIVDAERDGRLLGRPARWLLGLLVMVVAGYAYLYREAQDEGALPRYVTEEVVRGPLTVTVSATGNLQPTNQVDVGSELSGTIDRVAVDDNDPVRKGQELARLDLSKLRDALAKSRAKLASAEAQVRQAEASLKEAETNFHRLREMARLTKGKMPSKADLDTAEAKALRAEAELAVAHAGVLEAQATLSSDATNLDKASIRSPIDGVVLNRKVEPGQTVAASLQAPVLFTLAEDLTHMELQVDVDEADVGQVAEGQSARFSVDAYPGRDYPARIRRVGFGSQTKDGVVSYLTLLGVDNQDLSLRPGMTATAEIITATRQDALLVPNAALRFSPPRAASAPQSGGGLVARLLPRPPSTATARPKQPLVNADGSQQVWVLSGGEPTPTRVRVGVSDGRHSEILEGLEPGMRVITEVLEPAR